MLSLRLVRDKRLPINLNLLKNLLNNKNYHTGKMYLNYRTGTTGFAREPNPRLSAGYRIRYLIYVFSNVHIMHIRMLIATKDDLSCVWWREIIMASFGVF